MEIATRRRCCGAGLLVPLVEISSALMQHPLYGSRIRFWFGIDLVLERYIGLDFPLLIPHHGSSGIMENPVHSELHAYGPLTMEIFKAVVNNIVKSCVLC